jgi:hypothetical protein
MNCFQITQLTTFFLNSSLETAFCYTELRHSAAQFCPEHTRKILPKNRQRISVGKVDILVSVSKGDNHLRCCLISKIEMPVYAENSLYEKRDHTSAVVPTEAIV